MRMCFMQEALRESVSVSYGWKHAGIDHVVTCVSRVLSRFLSLGGGSSQTVPKRSQTIPNYAERELRKRSEPTNGTSHVEFSDSQSAWSQDK